MGRSVRSRPLAWRDAWGRSLTARTEEPEVVEWQGRVCLGTSRGVMVFRPGPPGEDWELVHGGLYTHQVTCVAEHPDGSLFAGAADGQVYTTEDWENWRPLYEGLDYPSVYALALDPEDPKKLYAGTSPAAVFRSRDRGAHWERLSSHSEVPSAELWTHPQAPHSPRVIRIFRHGRRDLFSAVSVGGVVASFDDGATWEDRSEGLTVHVTDLVAPLTAPSRLYASSILGFHRSDDLGKSWQAHNHGLPYIHARCLAVDPENPDRVLLSVDRPRGGGGVLFHSGDGGKIWEVATAELPDAEGQEVTGLAAGVGLMFAATGGGLLYGSKEGRDWFLLRSELPEIHTLIPLRGRPRPQQPTP